jgi:DNA polymerase
MIEAMGLSRESVYICNVLKTRPLNNATPTPAEIEACAPYLHEQVAIIDPQVIVTLGLPAAKAVLRCEATATMGALRSRWAEMCLPGGKKVAVMPTYHPAFLLRSYTPENRAKVWSDLQLVMGRLGLKGAEQPVNRA